MRAAFSETRVIAALRTRLYDAWQAREIARFKLTRGDLLTYISRCYPGHCLSLQPEVATCAPLTYAWWRVSAYNKGPASNDRVLKFALAVNYFFIALMAFKLHGESERRLRISVRCAREQLCANFGKRYYYYYYRISKNASILWTVDRGSCFSLMTTKIMCFEIAKERRTSGQFYAGPSRNTLHNWELISFYDTTKGHLLL